MESSVNSEIQKHRYLLLIGIYLLTQFVVGSIIIILIARMYATSNNLNYDTLINYLSNGIENNVINDYLKAYSIILGLSNLIIYSISLFFVIFLLYKDFKTDLNLFKERPKFNAIFIPICAILFITISMLFDLLLKNVGTSENQNTIVTILKHDGAAFMIIAVVLMAPVIEEFVYRKSVFKLLDFAPIWVSYLVSTLFFAIPHMLTTPINGNFGLWLLKLTPYLFAGVSFSFIYHKSNKNIYATIAVHMLNNLISVIFVYMGV